MYEIGRSSSIAMEPSVTAASIVVAIFARVSLDTNVFTMTNSTMSVKLVPLCRPVPSSACHRQIWIANDSSVLAALLSVAAR